MKGEINDCYFNQTLCIHLKFKNYSSWSWDFNNTNTGASYFAPGAPFRGPLLLSKGGLDLNCQTLVIQQCDQLCLDQMV